MTSKASLHVTHFGTATLLLEIGGLRILTDPVFDSPGGSAKVMGLPGTRYKCIDGPHGNVRDVLPIDIALVSHDQHLDNLDDAGRAMLPTARATLTTPDGARRLGGNAIGLKSFESRSYKMPEGGQLTISATPCWHGPPLSLPIVGAVTGFYLEADSLNGGIYISGDTVYYSGIEEVARKFKPALAFLHVGSVQMPTTGCLRYTFNAQDAARVTKLMDIPQVVPVHYQGWSHFKESDSQVRAAFEAAGYSPRLKLLKLGERTSIAIV